MLDYLKPCPFCGGEAKLYTKALNGAFVMCKTCHSSTDDYSGKNGEHMAVKAWNMRINED